MKSASHTHQQKPELTARNNNRSPYRPQWEPSELHLYQKKKTMISLTKKLKN